MSTADADLLTRLCDAARRQPEIVLAAVFGSVARGEARDGSDVDVAVLLDEGSASRRGAIEAELGRAAGPPQLRFEIARDGRLLFERRPYAWADFRARAMIDWWDWAPTAARIHHAAAERLRRRAADGSR